jgi:hypothetical protein
MGPSMPNAGKAMVGAGSASGARALSSANHTTRFGETAPRTDAMNRWRGLAIARRNLRSTTDTDGIILDRACSVSETLPACADDPHRSDRALAPCPDRALARLIVLPLFRTGLGLTIALGGFGGAGRDARLADGDWPALALLGLSVTVYG